MKKRMAKMVPVLCVAAMVGLTACSSAKPAETKAPETKAEAASEKEPAGEEPAAAVDFPKDTLNIICHAAAGGGSDALARQVAQGLQDGNGWTVTVDNKTGGSGSVGMAVCHEFQTGRLYHRYGSGGAFHDRGAWLCTAGSGGCPAAGLRHVLAGGALCACRRSL